MLNAGIVIPGLGEFRRDLRKIDPALTKELRGDLLAIGKDIAGDAQNLVPSKTGRARGSIKAGVSGNSAYVQGGKRDVPYFGWLDFGSRKPKRGNPRRVGPWKGSGPGPKEGRFIYPAIRRNRPRIKARAEAAFDKAAEKALQRTYQ